MVRRARQLGFEFRTRGGSRAGAGRPPNGSTAGVSHLRRPPHSPHHPLHITLRVRRGVPSLRDHLLFAKVRQALADGKERFGFSLVHFSVQRDHLHLIAEAEHRRALARGVQGLSIRVARAVNRHLGLNGKLFADRYHARALKTPRVVRLALRYVLLNVRKHTGAPKGSAGAHEQRRAVPTGAPKGSAGAHEQRRAVPTGAAKGSVGAHEQRRQEPAAGFVDPCSSAPWFSGFSRPQELAFGASEARSGWARASGMCTPPVNTPRSWLLHTGWKRAGAFDLDDVPGVS